jgi:predicted Rossmann fold nucleotide-binding protein DprA/Smf involved in DNA uptake
LLTAVDDSYPKRWLKVLGQSAPPAVWLTGELPATSEYISIVGSRSANRVALKFAEGCGAEAQRLGFSVASGGARGCDMAAMRKVDATARLEILPFGLRVAETGEQRGSRCAATRITVCAPNEEFTIGSAMERNALIYAIAEFAIVANARFKSGGAWHGAIDAHRRHLTRLIVREDNGNIAHRALAALGAIPLASASNLSTALSTNSVLQKQLIS